MIRLLRWLRERPQWGSDRGEGVVMVLVSLTVTAALATVYVGLPMLFGAIQDANDIRNGKWNKPADTAVSRPGSFPFIGPELPGDATQAACVTKNAALAGLQYGSRGWEAPGVYPRPSEGSSQGTIDAWVDQTKSYYNSRKDEWANCLSTSSSTSSDSSSSDEAPAYTGTYDVQYPPSADATCPFAPPATLQVWGGADSLTILGASGQVSDSLTGTLDRSFSFVVTGQRQVGGGLGLRMLGRFEKNGSDVLIRNGSLEFSAPDGPCTFEFTAKKRG